MNLENIKNNYYEQNDTVEKEYVDDKLNKQLNKRFEKEGNISDETFEGYYFEKSEEKGYDFYKKIYPNISDSELQQITNIQNSIELHKLCKDMHSIKNMLMFWFILTIIGLIVFIIGIVKIYNSISLV